MKYISIFFTILLIWIAVVLMALSRSDSDKIFQLFFATIVSTVVLFMIGFAKK